MIQVVIVFFGGGLGAAARHGVNIFAARTFGMTFPWGTFIVNLLGSAAMGALIAWLAFKAGAGWSQHVRLFLTTGVLGGFTTFSAFSLDAVLLWERGATLQAILYVAGSVGLALLGLAIGLAAVRALT